MAGFVLHRSVAAPPEVVFEVLTDHRAYPEFTPMRKVTLEREGEPEPNGRGAIRVLSAVGPPIREEIVEYERPTRFAYRILSGLPVRDHVGTVSLAPEGSGTNVTYRIETTPTIPLVGGAVVAALRFGINALLKGASGEAEQRATSATRGA